MGAMSWLLKSYPSCPTVNNILTSEHWPLHYPNVNSICLIDLGSSNPSLVIHDQALQCQEHRITFVLNQSCTCVSNQYYLWMEISYALEESITQLFAKCTLEDPKIYWSFWNASKCCQNSSKPNENVPNLLDPIRPLGPSVSPPGMAPTTYSNPRHGNALAHDIRGQLHPKCCLQNLLCQRCH